MSVSSSEDSARNMERLTPSFAPQKIVTRTSTSTVDCGVRVSVLAMLVDPPSTKNIKPEDDLRVYATAVDVSNYGYLSLYSKSRGPAAGFARGCPSAIMSV